MFWTEARDRSRIACLDLNGRANLRTNFFECGSHHLNPYNPYKGENYAPTSARRSWRRRNFGINDL